MNRNVLILQKIMSWINIKVKNTDRRTGVVISDQYSSTYIILTIKYDFSDETIRIKLDNNGHSLRAKGWQWYCPTRLIWFFM